VPVGESGHGPIIARGVRRSQTGTPQLTDGGALEQDGTAFDDMAEAAQEGDARLRLAEEGRPLEQAEPYEEDSGRS
jgi:hypothetical protein